MVLRAVDWFLRYEHWIIESAQKTNNINRLILTKAEQTGLIGSIMYHLTLAMPHQPMDEFVSPASFRF
jgi:hypothetical protein